MQKTKQNSAWSKKRISPRMSKLKYSMTKLQLCHLLNPNSPPSKKRFLKISP